MYKAGCSNIHVFDVEEAVMVTVVVVLRPHFTKLPNYLYCTHSHKYYTLCVHICTFIHVRYTCICVVAKLMCVVVQSVTRNYM